MSKKIFWDLDDCMISSAPLIQKEVNEKTKFKSDDLMALEQMIKGCQYIHQYNEQEIRRAINENAKPRLIGTIETGSNDIVRNEESSSSNKEKEIRRLRRWYQKPLEASFLACQKALWNKEMFLESRDNFLETDNANLEGIINYHDIYQMNNAINGAFETIREISNSGEYEISAILSHHNGGREEVAKKELIKKELANVPFIGLRFHLEAHQDGIRRIRSSKAMHIMQLYNLEDLEGCVLVDDSTANLDEWVKYGGTAILYRPMSEEEEYQGYLSDHKRNYERITKIDATQLNYALQMTKIKTLRKEENNRRIYG